MISTLSWREAILALLFLLSCISIFFIDPIPQDLSYHNFADSRIIFGIPNFYDVISNLLFAAVGILGIAYVFSHWEKEKSWSWLILFLAILLVAGGSSYYHFNPNNDSLTWDRLPMAVGFMALFAIVVGDYIYTKFETWLLIPMCLLGVTSVLYWNFTDDLRLYAWVQFFSTALLILVIFLYKPSTYLTKYFIFAFIFYALSKITEHFDKPIYALTSDTISGHTIKHLLAGIATFYFYLILKHKTTKY